MKWLRKLWAYPPDWRTVTGIWIGNTLFCTVLAVVYKDTWTALIDAALAGFSASSAMSTIMIKRYRDWFLQAREAYNDMAQLNTALIEKRVHFMMEQADDDDARPTIN